MDELLPKVDNWFEFLSVHRDMLADTVRIRAYKSAIKSSVHPGDVVVDMGTGTGILALLALQAGAARVYAIEAADIIKLAKRIAEKNGMNGRITFIHGKSQDTDLPEKADVLISEVIGEGAFEEGMLDAIIDARKRFLKPDGKVIPEVVDMYFVPAEADKTYREMSFWKGMVEGIDFSPAWDKLTNNVYVDCFDSARFLATPEALISADLRTLDRSDINGDAEFRCSRDGTLHGFIAWFKAQLSDDIVLSTSPEDPPTHWQSAYFPLDSPVAVRAGERVHFECACCSIESTTRWTWRGAVIGSDASTRTTFSRSTEAYWQ